MAEDKTPNSGQRQVAESATPQVVRIEKSAAAQGARIEELAAAFQGREIRSASPQGAAPSTVTIAQAQAANAQVQASAATQNNSNAAPEASTGS